MEHVEVVVKIPETVYRPIIEEGEICDAGVDILIGAIQDGTPLPKGHGRLIDADVVDDNIYDLTRSIDLNYGQISEVIDTAPTIIEADKGEEE